MPDIPEQELSISDLPAGRLIDMVNNMQAILNHSTESYVLASLEGIIRMINPSARTMIFKNEGVVANEGDNFFHYVHPSRLPLFLGYIEQVRQGKSISYVREMIQTDNHKTWVEFLLTPVYEQGVISATCIRARDVTAIKKSALLQQELEEEQVRKHHELTRAAIEAQELQRSETGKELHDNINQMLASVSVFLHHGLSTESERVMSIQQSIRILQQCTTEIRQLSKSLVPPSLGDLGLQPAIHELMGTVRLSGIRVRTQGLFLLEKYEFPGDIQLALFRILQEQVNNILRHSKAKSVMLSARITSDNLEIQLSDNGIGFDLQSTRHGIGLNNMYNRASAYNATIDISTSKGNGTSLKLSLSLHRLTSRPE